MFRKMKKVVAIAMVALLTACTAPEPAVKAAVTGWELVEREKLPLDEICFGTEDKLTGERYLIGLKNKKVTIVDMNGTIVAKTKYTWAEKPSVLLNGRTVLVVKKDDKAGLADLNGNEVLACSYKNITIEDTYHEHTLICYTRTDDSQFIKIDDKYVLENINTASFQMYHNELVVSVSQSDNSLYDIYDMTGKKKETLTEEQSWDVIEEAENEEDKIIEYEEDKMTEDDEEDEMIEDENLKGYCNKAEGRANYEKAKEEWLLAKEDELISGAGDYFSFLGRDIKCSKNNVFSAYQCLNGKMYYYIAVNLSMSKEFEDGKLNGEELWAWHHLATVNYIQIYDENRNLISEGQANLDKESVVDDPCCNEAVPFIVYVLDKEGNLLQFDAEKGSMEKLYTWEKESLFCQKDDYNGGKVDEGIIQVYMYDENCKITEQQGKNPDLYAAYRTSIFVSDGGEKKVYFPADKSVEEYDVYIRKHNLFLNSTADNQTDVYYYVSTKFEKLLTLKESIRAFDQKYSWCYPASYVGTRIRDERKNKIYCLVNKTKGTIYFIGENFSVVENCKDNIATELRYVDIYRYKEKFAFLFCAGPVTYDKNGNEIFMEDEAIYRFALLDFKKQSVSWENVSLNPIKVMTNEDDEIYYGTSGQKIYYLDLIKLEYKEIDMTNALAQQKGTVEHLVIEDHEPYVHYFVLDGNKKYYGYAILDGKIIYDAAVLKSGNDDERIQKLENYFLYAHVLLDKDYNVIGRVSWCERLVAYDERKYYSDFYLYLGNDVVFVYNKKTNKIIFDFKDISKKYYDGIVLGDYIMLSNNEDFDNEYGNLSDSLCINKTTGEVEKKFAKHYKVLDTKNRRYYAFKLKAEQIEGKNETGNTVQKGKSYVVGKQTYKVTDTTTKTVTLLKTSNKKTSEIIPAEVKIKGSAYKVTAIGDNVYKDNEKIKKVVIGSNIKTIGKNVWRNCKNLTAIQIKTKVLTKVGSSAIKGTNKKLKITVPSGKKKAYKKLWKGKGNDKVKI